MSDISNVPQPGITQPNPNTAQMLPEREAALRSLLGVDFEFASDSGLFDMFYYNPDTGEDSITHILSGDVSEDKDHGLLPGGFHHEPSAPDSQTYVDRRHLETKPSRSTREFREWPFNVYAAHVVIGGFRKVHVTNNPETGEREVHGANNGMFPKEYDPLAVLQTIRIASENQDHSKDREAGNLIISEGRAPLLHESGYMAVRICSDKESGKVVSAFPVTSKGRKQLTRQQIQEELGVASNG